MNRALLVLLLAAGIALSSPYWRSQLPTFANPPLDAPSLDTLKRHARTIHLTHLEDLVKPPIDAPPAAEDPEIEELVAVEPFTEATAVSSLPTPPATPSDRTLTPMDEDARTDVLRRLLALYDRIDPED